MPTAAEIRQSLDHPIIDADGHVLELVPLAHPYLEKALGPDLFRAYVERGPLMRRNQGQFTDEQRRRTRTPQGAWWGTHTRNVLDRATAMLPALLHERMDELGIDVSVLYPTNALLTCAEDDEAVRRALCRGFNRFYADIYGGHADRLRISGIIPMHTPDEAIDELEACHDLGLTVVCFPEGVLRPIEEPPGPDSTLWLFEGQRQWLDCFAVDSIHDYDPVWARARDLGFAVTFHGGLGLRPGIYTSITSYSYNHIAMFQQSMLPLVKALVMGGVTTRFPDVSFVALECGVSWACQLLLDTVEHWERRNVDALPMYDPAALDRDELASYFQRYGGDLPGVSTDELATMAQAMPIHGSTPTEPDEWRAMRISSEADIFDRFANIYFGCEADDRGISTAFGPLLPDGAGIRPIFSSDIGHWDVTDMAGVVPAAHSLLTDGLIDEAAFRQLMYENPASLYTTANPRFFDGTPVAPFMADAT